MDPCSICTEPLSGERRILACNHQFHQSCIDKWLEIKVTCPMCRDRGKRVIVNEDDATANERRAADDALMAEFFATRDYDLGDAIDDAAENGEESMNALSQAACEAYLRGPGKKIIQEAIFNLFIMSVGIGMYTIFKDC